MVRPIRNFKTIQMRKVITSFSFVRAYDKIDFNTDSVAHGLGLLVSIRGRRFFPSHCLLLGLAATMVGCGGSGDFPTAPVTGRVVCEGQPVGGAAVYFEPLRVGGSDVSAVVGAPGFAFTKPDGTFVISTSEIGAEDGAVVGMHRVRVGRGEAKCDCSMNDEKTLMEVEIKADGNNEFEIVLPKRTSQDDAREKMEKQFDPGAEEDE